MRRLARQHAFGRAGKPHVGSQPEGRLPRGLLKHRLIEIIQALRTHRLPRRIDYIVFGARIFGTLGDIIACELHENRTRNDEGTLAHEVENKG
jgi:hypothetical protein